MALSSTIACSPLGVTSVAPNTVESGIGTDITVTGEGFAEGMSLTLSSPGIDVTVGSVSVVDDQHATARVSALAPVGRFDLVASQNGDRATLEDAVTVVSGGATLVFIHVGQGDATLIRAPTGETLLVDGGRVENADEVKVALEKYASNRLDAVVISHFDVDHAGGVVEILMGDDGVPGTDDDVIPSTFMTPSGIEACDTQFCDRLRALRAVPTIPVVGDVIPLGVVDVDIVAVDGNVGDGPISPAIDDNGRSIVPRVSYGGRTALILGDLTGGGLSTVDVESPLSAKIGAVDVLRTAHHGSATSSNQTSLARFQPSIAVVSVGTDNPYCHPETSAFARITANATTVVLTGGGIVDDGDRCGGETVFFENATLGAGDVVVLFRADGTVERVTDD